MIESSLARGREERLRELERKAFVEAYARRTEELRGYALTPAEVEEIEAEARIEYPASA